MDKGGSFFRPFWLSIDRFSPSPSLNTSGKYDPVVCIDLLMKERQVISSCKISSDKQGIGSQAEEDALQFLLGSGLNLLDRNYRCRFGEIDLIMLDGSELVFVEVRKRKNMDFGGAAQSVSHAKQSRLIKTAKHFLMKYRQVPPCRFDVIAIEGDRCQWMKNVIEAQ